MGAGRVRVEPIASDRDGGTVAGMNETPLLPPGTASAAILRGRADGIAPGRWVLLPHGDGKLDRWQLVTAVDVPGPGHRRAMVVWDTVDAAGRERVWRVHPHSVALSCQQRPVDPPAPATAVRPLLKAAFPQTWFSVRGIRSGVRGSWSDGPASRRVSTVLQPVVMREWVLRRSTSAFFDALVLIRQAAEAHTRGDEPGKLVRRMSSLRSVGEDVFTAQERLMAQFLVRATDEADRDWWHLAEQLDRYRVEVLAGICGVNLAHPEPAPAVPTLRQASGTGAYRVP